MSDDVETLTKALRYFAEYVYDGRGGSSSLGKVACALSEAADTVDGLMERCEAQHLVIRNLSLKMLRWDYRKNGAIRILAWKCDACSGQWRDGHRERHAEGCLAA